MMRLVYGTICLFLLAFSAKGQSNGTALFDESYVHRIDVTFTQQQFWDSLSTYYDDAFQNGTDVKYMMGQVSIDGTNMDSIGVKQKGFFSNWGAGASLKKPLKLDLAEYVDGQKYDGLKKINLANGFEDPSMMRDVLAYKFMRDAGIHAPRAVYTELYINGTYWGLYVVVEEVDKNALENWFDDDGGNLYKCIDNTRLGWYGTNPLNYQVEFELQTNKDSADWSSFVNLVDKINNSPSATAFQSNMLEVLNVHDYLQILAADVIMYNWDSYYYHGRNFFLYHNPTTNLMEWIPWDYNLAFSDNVVDLIIDYTQLEPDYNKPFITDMQNDPAFRSLYFDHACILMDNYFSLEHLEPFINSTATLIRPYLNSDQNKFFPIQDFDESVDHDIQTQGTFGFGLYKGLKQFITERQTAVAAQLENHNHECSGLGINEQPVLQLNVFPNPTQGMISLKASETIERVEVYGLSGNLLKSVSVKQLEADISLQEYASGTYLINVVTPSARKTLSVIKE